MIIGTNKLVNYAIEFIIGNINHSLPFYPFASPHEQECRGIVFHGWHGTGDMYGAGVFAAGGGVFKYHNTDKEGCYIVNVNSDTGEVYEQDLDRTKKFIKFLKKVKRIMKGALNGCGNI